MSSTGAPGTTSGRGAGESDQVEQKKAPTESTGAVDATPVPLDETSAAPVAKATEGTTIKQPKRKSYTVDAKSLKDASAVIEAREEAGLTEWPTSASYQQDENGIVTKATVTISPEITMPVWPGYKDVSAAAKAEWDRAYTALEAHEQGHIAYVQQYMASVASTLAGKTKADADQALADALAALQKASDDYDTTTDHGINTGTVIDTSVE